MPAADGWCDASIKRLYDELALAGPDHAPIVEVGVWIGHSLIYLAKKVKEYERKIMLYGVDPFDGGAGATEEMKDFVQLHEGSLLKECVRNIEAAGVADVVVLYNMRSLDAARLWAAAERKLYAVFIDADHRYEAVKADIAAWLPLVRAGGVLAGHDIQDEGVRRAVTEAFGEDWVQDGNVWKVTKK